MISQLRGFSRSSLKMPEFLRELRRSRPPNLAVSPTGTLTADVRRDSTWRSAMLPSAVAINTATNTAVVANTTEGTISLINLATQTAAPAIPVGPVSDRSRCRQSIECRFDRKQRDKPGFARRPEHAGGYDDMPDSTRKWFVPAAFRDDTLSVHFPSASIHSHIAR